ncbi:MAG: sulfatase/phosphatase domain-containing protein, partial [Candidatus Thorarchaeota archaeon]
DITTSLLEIAGAKQLEGSKGRSLVLQVMAGSDSLGAQEGKNVIFSEVSGFSMVRSDTYKLIIDSASRNPVEMYDLKNDPNELNNLADDPLLDPVRRKLIDNYLNKLLDKIDQKKFKIFQDDRIKRTSSGETPKLVIE